MVDFGVEPAAQSEQARLDAELVENERQLEELGGNAAVLEKEQAELEKERVAAAAELEKERAAGAEREAALRAELERLKRSG